MRKRVHKNVKTGELAHLRPGHLQARVEKEGALGKWTTQQIGEKGDSVYPWSENQLEQR
jgi:hypothetical protein